mmetsp:Transcript_36428/g.117409  ORF Transcript_36428/g.117409 Transcript_36428/m.117409 type:complete len:314 (+) Transcript_36428:1578-2519(+)
MNVPGRTDVRIRIGAACASLGRWRRCAPPQPGWKERVQQPDGAHARRELADAHQLESGERRPHIPKAECAPRDGVQRREENEHIGGVRAREEAELAAAEQKALEAHGRRVDRESDAKQRGHRRHRRRRCPAHHARCVCRAMGLQAGSGAQHVRWRHGELRPRGAQGSDLAQACDRLQGGKGGRGRLDEVRLRVLLRRRAAVRPAAGGRGRVRGGGGVAVAPADAAAGRRFRGDDPSGECGPHQHRQQVGQQVDAAGAAHAAARDRRGRALDERHARRRARPQPPAHAHPRAGPSARAHLLGLQPAEPHGGVLE